MLHHQYLLLLDALPILKRLVVQENRFRVIDDGGYRQLFYCTGRSIIGATNTGSRLLLLRRDPGIITGLSCCVHVLGAGTARAIN